ncbi:MAG TPA: substrate-binding domain-containing protein [bacterium]|nr:substrate-binding domain-containing protein [bacterium]
MRLKPLLLLCLLLPWMAAWGHRQPPVTIGLCLDHGRGRELLLRLLEKAMDENQARLITRDAQDDPAAQVRQAQDLIGRGAQALVVLPCDPARESALAEQARRAGLKVVCLGQPLPSADYLIAFDRRKAGELQARALLAGHPRGRYLLLGKDREIRDGWMEALGPAIRKGDVQVAASTRWDPRTGPVDAVLAPDAASAQEAVEALAKSGLRGQVPVSGVGEDLPTCRRVLSGAQQSTVYRPAQKLAEETAYLSAKLARKAREFDCAFVEADNGASKIPAVLLTPRLLGAKDLESAVAGDGLWEPSDLQGH